MARPPGLEPGTCGLEIRCSIPDSPGEQPVGEGDAHRFAHTPDDLAVVMRSWSTLSEDARQRILANQLSAKTLPTLEDVDDLDSWLRAEAYLFEVRIQKDDG